ncbi:shikimate kinase [Salibacter halophilus]|uniref:Shikimate kinase n=1 Tax=Salibacter halophilus TaxID=1803916 RepID=A0A6N6M7Q4_9FLAO|nr:shikimate kinase [Salibacter halophilus]KAB1065934.1 shikimate kinase [Salibacter halophilus]
MQVFIIGFMGSGKTTVGKKLANKLEIPFYDLDNLIEDKEQQSISSIFETRGENAFREIENQRLRDFSGSDHYVLSTGGGTPVFHGNIDWMLANGVVVYLQAEPAFLASRLKNEKSKRPLIAGKNDEELKAFIDEMLEKREPYYKRAHFEIPAKGLNAQKLNELATTLTTQYPHRQTPR